MRYASAGFSFVSIVSSAVLTGFYLGIAAVPVPGLGSRLKASRLHGTLARHTTPNRVQG
jgi:hypothetical protein